MDEVWEMEKKSPIEVKSWSIIFGTTELYKIIRRELYQNIGTALCAVLVVCLLLTGDAYLSLFVVILVGVIDLESLALLSVLGITINPISLVCVLMSIGLTFE
jgi:multidrug efflux pump subunit AcrB